MNAASYQVLLAAPEIRVELVAASRLPAEEQSAVDKLWRSPQRPATAFDGWVLTFCGLNTDLRPPLIQAARLPYRVFWAWRRGVKLTRPPVPLAVSGVTCLGLPKNQWLLWGRRSQEVEEYKGVWELPPAGGLDAAGLEAGQLVDYKAQLLVELHEEVGVVAGEVASITTLGLVRDNLHQVLDICCRLDLKLSPEDLTERSRPNHEFQEFRPLTLAQSIALAAQRGIVPTSLGILELLGATFPALH